MKAVELSGQHAAQAPVKPGAEYRGKPCASVEDARGHHVAQRCKVGWMRVAEIGRGRAADEVKIASALRIDDPGPAWPGQLRFTMSHQRWTQATSTSMEAQTSPR